MNDTTYWGLKLYEWLTLVGVIIGPIVAVSVTLWVEGRRQKHDRQATVGRILMGTRHTPADPQYNGAINLIPIEFNDCPAIVSAWQQYMGAVRYEPTETNRQQHERDVAARQSTLIFLILQHLKYSVSESDIQTNAYISRGFVDRDQLLLRAQLAWIRIADALERSSPPPIEPGEHQ